MKIGVKRRFWELFVCLNLICLIAFYTTVTSPPNNNIRDVDVVIKGSSSTTQLDDLLDRHPRRDNRTTILFWTGFFGDAFPFQKQMNCLDTCRVTTNKDLIGYSDAVVFHAREDISKDPIPVYHPANQIWIFFLMESPENSEKFSKYSNVFNWTMTYRQDSDVYLPYSQFERIQRSRTTNRTRIFHSNNSEVPVKSRASLLERPSLVAWVVSNCDTGSNREGFVNELIEYIPVDIYGQCGTHKCPEKGKSCYPVIGEKYKFYLSFENSLCEDYVTEKFYDALRYDLVPIVYGGADYASLAPPGSFINARDFESPKSLANYLWYLSNHPEEYLKYFQWKDYFQLGLPDVWCEACSKLQKLHRTSEHQWYSRLDKWWSSVPDIPRNPIKNNNTFSEPFKSVTFEPNSLLTWSPPPKVFPYSSTFITRSKSNTNSHHHQPSPDVTYKSACVTKSVRQKIWVWIRRIWSKNVYSG